MSFFFFLPPFPFLNLSSQSTDSMVRAFIQTRGPVGSPGDDGRQLEAAPALCLSLPGLIEQLQWNQFFQDSLHSLSVFSTGWDREARARFWASISLPLSFLRNSRPEWGSAFPHISFFFSPWSKLYLLSAHNWNPNIKPRTFISVDPALDVKPPLLAVSRVAAASGAPVYTSPCSVLCHCPQPEDRELKPTAYLNDLNDGVAWSEGKKTLRQKTKHLVNRSESSRFFLLIKDVFEVVSGIWSYI